MIGIRLTKVAEGSECLEITRRDGTTVKIEMLGLAEDTIFRFAVESELRLEGTLHQVGNGAEPLAIPTTAISMQVDALVKALKDHGLNAPVRDVIQTMSTLCQHLGVEILPITTWKIEIIRQRVGSLSSQWANIPKSESLQLEFS